MPEDWLHAVVNLDYSVAVGGQARVPAGRYTLSAALFDGDRLEEEAAEALSRRARQGQRPDSNAAKVAMLQQRLAAAAEHLGPGSGFHRNGELLFTAGAMALELARRLQSSEGGTETAVQYAKASAALAAAARQWNTGTGFPGPEAQDTWAEAQCMLGRREEGVEAFVSLGGPMAGLGGSSAAAGRCELAEGAVGKDFRAKGFRARAARLKAARHFIAALELEEEGEAGKFARGALTAMGRVANSEGDGALAKLIAGAGIVVRQGAPPL